MPSAPTIASGIRSTVAGLLADRRVVDMANEIYYYDDEKRAPFITILSQRAQAVRASAPDFNHMEDQPLPRWDVLGGAMASTTALQIQVANPAYFRAGDVVLVASSSLTGGEYMKVVSTTKQGDGTSAFTGSNNLGVLRNATGDLTTGGTASSGAYVAIIGNVNEEGTTIRTIKQTSPVKVTNYTQIIRTPFGLTNTLDGTSLYGGDEMTVQRRKNTTEHNRSVEHAFLLGKKALNTGANGFPERYTGGILSWISTNVVNANGTLTEATLESWSESLFRYSPNSKLVLASRRFATQLDLIAAGRITVTDRADTYGVAVKRFTSSHGDLMVAIDDLLVNDFAGYAIAIDMDNIRKRYMTDRKGSRENRLNTNIQDPSADAEEDEYLSEVGLHVIKEAAHGVLKGLS